MSSSTILPGRVRHRWGTRSRAVTAVLALLTLISCGGGGGGGGESGGGVSGSPVSALSCALPPTLAGSVAASLSTGNALAGPSTAEFLSATLATMAHYQSAFDPVITQLYNLNADGTARGDGSSLNALSWDPSHDSILITPSFGENAEVIVSNIDNTGAVAPPRGLAVAGTYAGKSRYMVMASNPFRTSASGSQMDQFLKNAIQWLTGKAPASALKVALVQLDDSFYFRDETATRAWLAAKYGSAVSYNAANVYDGTNLGKILTDGADLVIVSQQLDAGQDATQVRNGIKALMDAGKPVMYVQLDGTMNALGTQLFDLFQVQSAGDNYWSYYKAGNLNGTSLPGRLSPENTAIRETLTRLSSGTYSFTLPQVATDNSLASYKTEFLNGAQAVRSMMHAYDNKPSNIFLTCGRELPKLLALTGDRIRQDIAYPLSTATSTPKNFLQAFYADHAVYNARLINPAQKNLGTFSRSDFSNVAPVTRNVTLVSRPSFRATGAYALPGRTVKVTRLDSNNVTTSIFVNSLRASSTHMWDDGNHGGYARPKFLQSTWMAVRPGESIYLTSPYGGPLQVNFDKKDITVQLKFENVSEHPYWSGPQDNASFAAQLAASTHDWVEVSTNGFEMHSKIDRFKNETLANPNWNTPAKLGAATMRYTYDFTHVIAGLQGDGIDQEPEVYGWAVARGLTVPTTDTVKHMNADVPSCGWGCSGNPYDAGWAFSPIGHGDLHELGHSLQSPRWQLKHGTRDYPNHAGTNFYAYYPQARFYDDTGQLPGNQGMPFRTIFLQLQAAYTAGDRPGMFSTTMASYFDNYLATQGESGIYNSYAFFMQAMMQARQKGLLTNGHHIIGRLHVIDRAFREAVKSQATWDADKAKFGFSQMAFADAQTLNNNDFMVVAMSFASGLDLRDYFAMWGFSVGSAAGAQVANFAYPVAERVFFAMTDKGWVEGALSTRVNSFQKLGINGTTAWPLTP
jgi:hypothetical protein